MIYTLTLNPGIDLLVQTNNFKIGEVNRTSSSFMIAGGKGINVSRVLNTLNRDNTALGFVGGFTGQFIESELKKQGIKTDFVHIKNTTRINVKIADKKETAINTHSPILFKEEINQLIDKLSLLEKGDILVCSGRLPESLKLEEFSKILENLHKKEVILVIDMSGEALKESLKFEPFLIKPNLEEFEELFDIKINNKNDLNFYAKKVLDSGVKNILVSLDEDGAVLINENGIYSAKAPKGKVLNSVGAGDSMVAGFIDEFLKENNFQKSLEKGVIVGSATAFSIDLADKNEIEKVFKEYYKTK